MWWRLLLAVFFLVSCEDRARLNPLDPENHLSHGAPQGLRVFTHRDTARLSWHPFEVDFLKTYALYRGGDPENLIFFQTVPGSQSVFTDYGLRYDQPYYYAVQAITDFSQSAVTEPVKVIPGPWNIWVADMYGLLLRNISYDGTTIVSEQEFSSPRSVEYDPGEKILWVGDYFQKRIFGFTPTLEEVRSIELNAEPVALSLDSLDQTVFAVLEDNHLYAFTYSGSLRWKVDLGREITLATELAFNPFTGNVWISMSATHEIFLVRSRSSSRLPVKIATVNNPGPLEAEPLGAGAWVSTAAGIARIDSTGIRGVYKQELFIHDLSLDPATGDCYYTGSLERFAHWETGYLKHDSPETGSVILGDSVSQVYNLQVVPGTGAPGILVQEALTHTLIRYTHDGVKLGETGGYSSHLDFVLD